MVGNFCSLARTNMKIYHMEWHQKLAFHSRSLAHTYGYLDHGRDLEIASERRSLQDATRAEVAHQLQCLVHTHHHTADLLGDPAKQRLASSLRRHTHGQNLDALDPCSYSSTLTVCSALTSGSGCSSSSSSRSVKSMPLVGWLVGQDWLVGGGAVFGWRT